MVADALIALTFWSVPVFASGQQQATVHDAGGSGRQQLTQTPQETQPPTSTAQKVIQQLQDRQERGLAAAPEGFEYFQGKGYRFLVPAPMELEGREANMTKISVMSTRMLVMAGDPVTENAEGPSTSFDHSKNGSWQGPYSSGTKVKFGKHTGWLYKVSAKDYSGSTAIIFGKGRTIEIRCVNQQELLITSGKASYKEQRLYLSKALAQANDRQNTEAMCQELFQSVELEEDGDDLPEASPQYDPGKAARSAAVLRQTAAEPALEAGASLGDLGREQRALPRGHASSSFDAIGDPDKLPAGFRWLGLSEACNPQCKRARMLLPESASGIPDYPEVYQMSLDKAVVRLFAGRLRTWTGTAALPPSLWIQEKFANPTFGVSLRTSPTITPIYEEEKMIHGLQAKISRVRVVDAAGNVFLGEGAVFKISGDIGIGCLIPENKFGEFEPVCSQMIDSLQVE